MTGPSIKNSAPAESLRAQLCGLAVGARNFSRRAEFEDLLDLIQKAGLPASADPLYADLFAAAAAAYSKEFFREAARLYLACHSGGNRGDAVLDELLKKFNLPLEPDFRARYEKNRSSLKNYPLFFDNPLPVFEDLKFRFIPYDRVNFPNLTRYAVFDSAKKTFAEDYTLMMALPAGASKDGFSGKVVFFNEMYDSLFISWLQAGGARSGPNGETVPLLLFYSDANVFAEHLQVFDFENVLKSGSAIFLFGAEKYFEFMENTEIMPPEKFISFASRYSMNPESVLAACEERMEKRKKNRAREIREHYSSLAPGDIARKIAEKKAKIAFLTSRYTTAVQYFARDCVKALRNLGFEAELVIEKSNFSANYREIYDRCFHDLKPDMVFTIDHLRDMADAPAESIFVTWIQDFMPQLFTKESAEKIGPHDFIMNLFYSGNELCELGYPPDRMVAAPMIVDPELYRHYDLSDEERSRYSTDICYISNSGDIALSFDEFMKKFSNIGSAAQILRKNLASPWSQYSTVYIAAGKIITTPRSSTEYF